MVHSEYKLPHMPIGNNRCSFRCCLFAMIEIKGFFAFHVVSTHQVDAACVVKVDCVITMRSMKVSLL